MREIDLYISVNLIIIFCCPFFPEGKLAYPSFFLGKNAQKSADEPIVIFDESRSVLGIAVV